MSNIQPFGTNSASGTPELGVQEFCGALVQSFDCSADFASQGGKLSVTLIEDEDNNYFFNVPVISAPTGFIIRDTSSNLIFEFYGIFDSVTRDSSSSEKKYSVSLSSPLKILEAVNIITDTYAGYGTAKEGLPRYFSDDGYWNIPNSPDNYLPEGVSKVPSVEYFQIGNLAFGTNNSNLDYTGMWANQYNFVNVFGAFENEFAGIVNFKGFGVSATSDDGMTLDRVCYALDALINKTSDSDIQRYLGGNILFGTNTYNICSTALGYTAPFPYYYGFDAIGFYNQVLPYVGSNYRIKGPISLLGMISQVCDDINADFLVNLERISYTSGDFTSYDNTIYSVYSTGEFELSKTYPNSLLGGVIWVQVIPRNTYINCNRPFSAVAYNLLSLEVPNNGGYGVENNINPGIPATGYIDPLDDDFFSKGTSASTPYGGSFPVDTSDGTGDELSYHLNRASSISLSLKATDSVTSKMVVGGYQSRMVTVPRDYIYQYWGDIKIRSSGNPDCQALNRYSDKVIPVITQILPPNDIVDIVMVDVADILPRNIDFWNIDYWDYWRNSVQYPLVLSDSGLISSLKERFSSKENVSIHPIHSGVYFASVSEIRAAMKGIDEWEDYMSKIKLNKYMCLESFFKGYSAKVNQVTVTKFNQAFARLPAEIQTKSFRSKKRNKSVKYTGKKEVLEQNLKLTLPEEVEDSDFIEKLAEKLKFIGDEHYGRSWYAPVPFFTTKVTENDDNLFGNYVRSWDLTDSAYVEPYLYSTIDAPFDSKFQNEGKLLPFVNFEYHMSGNGLGYDLFTDSVIGFTENEKSVFNFSEYALDSIVIDNTGCFTEPLVHVAPSELSNSYHFIPCNYFGVYNRYTAPFFEILTAGTIVDPVGNERVSGLFGATYAYNSPSRTGVMPSGALNSCGSAASLINSKFNDAARRTSLVTSGVMATGYNNFYIQYPTQANVNLVTNLLNIRFSDNGLNSLPFVRFKTERVLYPINRDSGVYPNSDNFALTLALLSYGDNGRPVTQEEIDEYLDGNPVVKEQSKLINSFELFDPILPPKSICIPQVSNRFVYGPWMTNYDIIYCGKVEFEVDQNLVPENYIIPAYGSMTLAGGTFSSGIQSQLSGFAGMNLAGQARANSIDNFSLFASEEGTITLPGLPLISRIGQSLLSGPKITDIQVYLNASEINTTYNFRQNSPRLGKTNRDIIKLLGKLGQTTRK